MFHLDLFTKSISATTSSYPTAISLISSALDNVLEWSAAGEPRQLLADHPVGAHPGLVDRAAHVRGKQQPRRLPERVAVRERLGVGHVERGGDPAARQLSE